ncbi:MAG: LPS-assembly protein LptD, partial [Bacteriovoracaceae bacterium]|nr:LPS-assembly protein LptD [Bacteriovoracaceae bacterium]
MDICYSNFIIATAQAQVDSDEKLQLQFGDEVSIYSNKAYRKRNGELFEVVGSVVILHKDDTLYGESASFDMKSGFFKIEGNVRYVTKGMTLYGSSMEYNLNTGFMVMLNARIVSEAFNIVANRIEKRGEDNYYAEEAEYSTCQNCPESWSIYGQKIDLKFGEYVTIRNGIIKLNTIDVMIIPFLVLPVKQGRHSGLLFPKLSQRFSEGVAFEQPWYWAISDNRDLTFTPTFWATRGYGSDFEYRHIFTESSWLELNSRLVNDKIYQPLKLNNDPSGDTFFRHLTEAEIHVQPSHNWNSHVRFTEVRDLDMIQNYSIYADPKVLGSDVGLNGFVEYRSNMFTFSGETEFNRNQLTNNPDKFDDQYVQVLPELNFSLLPQRLYHSRNLMLYQLSVGADVKYTNFRQNVFDESAGSIRNAKRLSLNPYLDWNFFTKGPYVFNTRYLFDYQTYDFGSAHPENLQKVSNVLKTSFSFEVEKVFGLAYQESVPVQKITEDSLEKLRDTKAPDADKTSEFVGSLPAFEETDKDDVVLVKKNAYKHTQEFKLIHSYLFDQKIQGNPAFATQIQTSSTGWFDYTDAVRSQETELGINNNRTMVPYDNTLELQWNNVLIKKEPKKNTELHDQNFLMDNFSYKKVGYFNLSQGVSLKSNDTAANDDFSQRLTRLHADTGFYFDDWSLRLEEFYFHATSDNILRASLYKYFEKVQVYLKYNLNTFSQSASGSDLKTLMLGFQLMPADILRFSAIQEYDISADKETRRLYDIDYIPNNNCYIFNLN